MLSLFICGTAVTSQYLAEQYKVNTPMLQSFTNYCLLLLVYTTMLALRTDNESFLQILKRRWWKYILLGLADVEANYMIVKAYQYTTLTSVQLLDCFGIPVLMALSWFILRARYRLIHFIAVAVCLLGVGTMVGADILAGRQEGEDSRRDVEVTGCSSTCTSCPAKRSNVVIGDVLVLLGASLYAISNVSEEYIVKNLSRVEFLGMVGLFGTIISALQLAIVEYRDIARIQWNWKIALLFMAFALCMFGLYSFMPVVIKVTSATSVNLGILTADLYSLFFGLFLFCYKAPRQPSLPGRRLESMNLLLVIQSCLTSKQPGAECSSRLHQWGPHAHGLQQGCEGFSKGKETLDLLESFVILPFANS
ncbi:solute carrier family 35 member F2 isoform X2 [Alligator sinensis]|uniref:Solute carrier family 35 member F2 isoform X2 n=1 Tax=Alligator sinensis TaxID=38654 RepID=A0A3Q0FMS2_ALLSI|nr:solute carrier family 35 member F2 isoform X2 [Alligator sinensis]